MSHAQTELLDQEQTELKTNFYPYSNQQLANQHRRVDWHSDTDTDSNTMYWLLGCNKEMTCAQTKVHIIEN